MEIEQTATSKTIKLIELLKSDFDFHGQINEIPSHNFHSFPAKFPPQLPHKLINELSKVGEMVLDPMVGSGTTLVEAQGLNRHSIGFDIDPLARLISKVKTSYIDRQLVINTLIPLIRKASARVSASSDGLRSEILAFFNSETVNFIDMWFLPSTQAELFALSQEINQINDQDIQDFFKVAFSSTIITKSGGVSLALDLGHTRPHLAKKVMDKDGKVIIGDLNTDYSRHSQKIVRPVFTEFKKSVW